MQPHRFLLTLTAAAAAALIVPQPAESAMVISESITLASFRNTGSTFQANDFHIRFKADRQSFTVPANPVWQQLTVGDIRSDGYYFLCGQPSPTTFTQWVDGEGYINMYWTFPTVTLDANAGPSMFGFTTLGGVRFTDVQWWWTFDGTDVRQLPEVWQDWYYESGVLVDRIRNGTGAPVELARVTGSQVPTVGIADVAGMGGTPPNPVVVNPPESRLVLPGNDASVNYTWPWPAGDPSYYMFYQFNTGGNDITFTNAANVIPESSVALLAAGAGLLLSFRRRRIRPA
jgi:hypothetical protein